MTAANDAETAVIGICLGDPKILANGSRPPLTGQHFRQPTTGQVWDRMITLADTGSPADPVVLAADLQEHEPSEHRLRPLLAVVEDAVGHNGIPANLDHYVRIIQDGHRRRTLEDLATTIRAGLNQGDDVDAIEAKIRDRLDEVDNQGPRSAGTDYQSKYPRLDIAALLTNDAIQREYLVDRLIVAGSSTTIAAPAGHGKSLLVLSMCIAITAGHRAWAGLRIPRPRRILYIDRENPDYELQDRFSDLGLTPANVPESLVFLHLPALPPLDTPAGGRELLAIVQAYGLGPRDVVVLDSFQRMVAGPEDASDTLRAYYLCTAELLKRERMTVIRLDNTGHKNQERSRGTSGKQDDVELELALKRSGETLTLTGGKGRSRDSLDRLVITQTSDDDGRVYFTTEHDPMIGKINAVIARLDALKVPRDASQRAAQKALRDDHFEATREVIRGAVAARKRGPGGTS